MSTTMDESALNAFVATIAAMPVEKRVKLYLKTRAAKTDASRAFDAQAAQFDRIMEACQHTMLADATKQGITGFKTPFGTTYKDEVVRYSIADANAFYRFIEAQKDMDFLERRVSSTHVKEYMEANEGALPPGLSVFRENVMRVRKK